MVDTLVLDVRFVLRTIGDVLSSGCVMVRDKYAQLSFKSLDVYIRLLFIINGCLWDKHRR